MFIALLGYIGTRRRRRLSPRWWWFGTTSSGRSSRKRYGSNHVDRRCDAGRAGVATWSLGPSGHSQSRRRRGCGGECEDARLAAAQAAAAEKAKRLKQARYQKRKEREQLARQRDDQQYSAALGYEQEPSQTPVFGLFGPRRF